MELKQRTRKIWNGFLRPFLIMVILLASFRSAVADWNDVPTGSMKPTILEGDRILVNKLAYGLKVPFTTWHLVRWDQPQRGEIVVFFSPRDGTRLVKRIVGLPGETVEIRGNRLAISGEFAEYGPLADEQVRALLAGERPTGWVQTERSGEHSHPVMLHDNWSFFGPIGPIPEGYYFVLGDNRDNSADSRSIGLVHQDQIVGRSSRVALSLDYQRSYMPRWERFLAKLP